MAEYYFLGVLLPPLKWEDTPILTFKEIGLLLEENLSKEDLKEFHRFRLFFDLENIRAFWMKQPLDPVGVLNEKEMEEALQREYYFPPYVFDFLNNKDTLSARLHSFPELVALYFQEEIPKASQFFKKYLEFEKGLRLTLLALRTKTLKRDLLVELQYEDPQEEMIVDILSQKDAKEYVPEERYNSLKELYEKNIHAPLNFFEALCKYRFEWIERSIKGDPFSFERILGEVVKLMLIERWNRLDQKRGLHILREAL